jgi:predicted nucleic acid-binding Zn ribbon protein
MPTYEFRLPDGTIIERSFKISEVPDEIPNPNGEGAAVRIISGGAGLLFKGSGFYLTDYGRNAHRTQGDAPKPSASAASGESNSGAKSDASSGAASESKPAAAPKAEPKSPPPSAGSGGTSDS